MDRTQPPTPPTGQTAHQHRTEHGAQSNPPQGDQSQRGIALAAGIDSFWVMLFVAAGRRTHDEANAIGDLLQTVTPFLIALAVGWIVARAWDRPLPLSTGAVVWAVTTVVGIGLRRVVFGDGIALSFVIVAAAFLALGLIGWRAIAAGAVAFSARSGPDA